MQDSKFREILYNDVRTAGHGIGAYNEFLEFSAMVGSFVPQSVPSPTLPMTPKSVGSGTTVVSAGIVTASQELPPLPSVQAPPAAPPELPVTPKQATPVAPALPELPTVQTPPPVPELPISPPIKQVPQELPTFQATPPAVASAMELDASESLVFNPIQHLPQRSVMPRNDPPELPQLPRPSVRSSSPAMPVADPQPAVVPEAPQLQEVEGWSYNEIEDVFKRNAPPLPELPKQKPQKPPVRGASPNDPHGYQRYIDEQQSADMGMRGAVDAMLSWQDDAHRRANTVQSQMTEVMERLAIDNNNDERRIRALNSALQRSRTTLSDVHI